MTKAEGGISCSTCASLECRHDYPDGIPDYCVVNRFHSEISKTVKKYSGPDVIEIYKAASAVVTKGYGKWPRVKEAIEFARELKLSKIGLASCVALIRELRSISELFIGGGLS